MTFHRTRTATTVAAAAALLLTSSATATALAQQQPPPQPAASAAASAAAATAKSVAPQRDTTPGGVALDRAAAAASVVPGRFIVRYKPGRTPTTATPGRLGVRAVRSYTHALRGYTATLDAAQLAAVRSDPAVASVRLDRVLHASDTQTPATWGLDRIDQRELPLDGTYTYPYDGTGVTAYVIDTGLRATHTDFAGRVGTGINFVDDTGYGADPNNTTDCDGHGTHVAGTVGGSTYGVAKGVTIVPVRVLDCEGSGYTSDVIAGIDWVTAHHAANAVANMSLGGDSIDADLDAALQSSIASGVTYLVAAGNEMVNACTQSPAHLPAAITVGAITSGDDAADYSNWGSCLDLYAPGSSIVSAGYTSDTATATLSGTSMATPHVAGLAAQFLQAHPGSTPAQVRAYLVGYGVHGLLGRLMPGDPDVLAHVPTDVEPPLITAIGGRLSGTSATATITANDLATDVHGYSFIWSRNPTANTTVVDPVEDGTAPVITSGPLPEGRWYLHVRAGDTAGNWSGVANSGVFVVDVTAPRLTLLRIKPASRTRYAVTLGATDNLSGVGAVQLYWNHSRTALGGLYQVTRPGTVLSPVLSRGQWYVHVRVVDTAGRASRWTTAGPYGAPVPFVSGAVTQGARCTTAQRNVFAFTRSHVLERCLRTATSTILRWRPY